MSSTLTVPTTPVEDAIAAVGDSSLPIEQRAGPYAVLRAIRLRIDRALRPVGQEIQRAMTEAGEDRWGPIRLTWRAVDPRYVCNDPGNWGDAGVQDDLALWAAESRYTAPDGTPWVIRIPDHYEIDTRALGAALAAGDPAARELYRLLNEKRYRTEEARAATLTVDEVKP